LERTDQPLELLGDGLMTSNFLRWYTAARRYFGVPKTIRRPRYAHLRRVELESRLAPAIFTGGVSVASGDINGDGLQDIITGAGPGGSSLVKVFSGANGQIIRQFNAFDPGYTGGVFVAVGDVNGDGKPDIICGSGQGDPPRVRVFDGFTGAMIYDFMPYNRHFRGGVRVAAADVDGDHHADIITGAGPGGSAHVEVFSGATGKVIASFNAFDAGFTGGVYVAGGDITGDGKADVVVGAGEGGTPIVSVFNMNSSTQSTSVRSFFAFNPNFHGGVRVGIDDISTGRPEDIIAAAGPGGGPDVKVFDGTTNAVDREFFAYGANFHGGVFVGSHTNIDNQGAQDILTGAGAGGGPHVEVFNGDSLQRMASFFAYEPNTSPGPFAVPSIDVTPPVITITSPIGTPTQKTNLVVSGRVTDDKSGVKSLTATVDGGAAQNVAVGANGNFSFTTVFAVNGTDDGPHTVQFAAQDRAGNNSKIVAASFTLDTFVTPPTLSLDPNSDTGTKGDLITSDTNVTILGKTDAGVAVTLVQTGAHATADSQGNFQFTNIQLQAGANSFTVQATDSLGNTSQGTISIRLNSPPTVSSVIADVNVGKSAQDTVIDLSTHFTDPDLVNTHIRFNTSAGPVDVELFDSTQPLTVANFLNYIDSGRFTNSIFHRLVKNFVLQGGGFTFDSSTHQLNAITTDPAVLNEPGRSNVRGTIAMAKVGNDPNSATSQFFFNLADNSANLDNQNGGFTVFGDVIAGMDAIDSLATFDIQDHGGVFNEIPLRGYTGTNFPTDTRYSNYAGLNSVAVTQRSDRLTFTVTNNDNPGLVTTSISGKNLTLHYATGQTGTANITVRATDLDGRFVETTFKVTVTNNPPP
jgi:cyclophilin family peptidyl-prolyl cis-trans isomerase